MAPRQTPLIRRDLAGIYRPSASETADHRGRNKADITGETLGMSEVNGHA